MRRHTCIECGGRAYHAYYVVPKDLGGTRTVALCRECFDLIHSKCFDCGGLASVTHHVVPKRLGGSRTVPLCPGCHGRAHSINAAHPVLTRIALIEKKRRGERVGGLPYGFRLAADGKTLEPHPDEVETVLRARELRGQGLSLRGIANTLDSEGRFSRRGGKFAATQVSRLLEVTDTEVLEVGEFSEDHCRAT